MAYVRHVAKLGGNKMEINKPKDKDNMTEAEKKHTPVIEASNNTVTVKVGEITHPMEGEHYITYIELFKENESIAKKELNPGDKPEAVFENVPTENLKAQSNCNLHGLWESV
jgi:superoxide reductase